MDTYMDTCMGAEWSNGGQFGYHHEVTACALLLCDSNSTTRAPEHQSTRAPE